MSTPSTVVEIAFNAGYTTPAASRTWTDVSAYVLEAPKVGITYGRQDELSLADANQLALAFDNSDGRFTWGNASSPYYPNVKIGRPVRVRTTEAQRTNLAFNPRAISTGYLGEYLARSSWTRSFITGTTGPVADVTTAARFTNVTDDVSVTGRGMDIYGSASAVPPGTAGDWIKQPVTPGDTVTVSGYVRSSVATTWRMSTKFHDGAGNWVDAQAFGTSVVASANAWVRVSKTTVVPVGATHLTARLDNGVSATFPDGATIDATCLLVEEASAVADFFDGATPDGNLTYAWSSTENASTSTQVATGAVRYTGFINEWPVEWPGVVTTFATTSTSASSRLSRLGLNTPVLSVIEHECLIDDPAAYFTMGEAAGAVVANDTSGNYATALRQVGSGTSVTFGTATGPGTDSLTAATFAAGKYLQATDLDGLHVDFWFATSASGLHALLMSDGGIGLVVSSGNKLGFQNGLLGVTELSAGTVNDGLVHHVAWNNTTGEAWLDGASLGTAPAIMAAGRYVGGDPSGLSATLSGSMAHVGFYSSPLSAARVADHYEAGATGHAGETTDERLERYAGWAHIDLTEVVTTASAITLDHIDSGGQQIVELMRKVEASEAGVLHDDRDGNLRLRTRSARYGSAVAVTLSVSAGQVGVDYKPNVDRSVLYTIGDGQNVDGTITARYIDETDRSEYGDATYSVTTAAQDDDEPLHLAAWVVNANSAPRPRAPQVTVNLMPYLIAGDTATLAALLALDIGSKVRISNAPSQAPATTADYFVEGYREDVGVGVWSLALNLSPAYPYDDVLILDSATDGLLDTNILAL